MERRRLSRAETSRDRFSERFVRLWAVLSTEEFRRIREPLTCLELIEEGLRLGASFAFLLLFPCFVHCEELGSKNDLVSFLPWSDHKHGICVSGPSVLESEPLHLFPDLVYREVESIICFSDLLNVSR